MEMTSLENRRIQDMLMLVYKSLRGATPAYITSLLTARINAYGLRGINKLQQPRVNTTSYGKHFFKLTAAKYWNTLTDELRTAPCLTNFRNNIKACAFNLIISNFHLI